MIYVFNPENISDSNLCLSHEDRAEHLLTWNGDQACSPKFEAALVEYLPLDDHATNTSTHVDSWSIHEHER